MFLQQNEDLYIQCIYNSVKKVNETEKYEHVISLFNHKTLKLEHKEVLEEDIAMVDASVDGIPGKLLIDSCSNLNIITKQYFDKLPNEYRGNI